MNSFLHKKKEKEFASAKPAVSTGSQPVKQQGVVQPAGPPTISQQQAKNQTSSQQSLGGPSQQGKQQPSLSQQAKPHAGPPQQTKPLQGDQAVAEAEAFECELCNITCKSERVQKFCKQE